MLAIDYRPVTEDHPDRVKTDDPPNLVLTVTIPEPAETWFKDPATSLVMHNLYQNSKDGSLAISIANEIEGLKKTFNPNTFASVMTSILEYDPSHQLYVDIISMMGVAVDSVYAAKKIEFFETMCHVFNSEMNADTEKDSLTPDENIASDSDDEDIPEAEAEAVEEPAE